MRIISCLFIGLFLTSLLPDSLPAQLTPEQHQALIRTSQDLARRGIRYGGRWHPPGEKTSWIMDCSNTARWVYWAALKKELPRTASDQYYELHQQGRITPVPKLSNGTIDTKRLYSMLRSGDLLFWEWTYNTKRRPPITHVMIYLGHTSDGVHKMMGSNTRSRGDLSGTLGGPDIFNFNPSHPMGGVRGPQDGKFVAFGRPK
jgi:hypothetical protein